jgi:hypothetical protein
MGGVLSSINMIDLFVYNEWNVFGSYVAKSVLFLPIFLFGVWCTRYKLSKSQKRTEVYFQTFQGSADFERQSDLLIHTKSFKWEAIEQYWRSLQLDVVTTRAKNLRLFESSYNVAAKQSPDDFMLHMIYAAYSMSYKIPNNIRGIVRKCISDSFDHQFFLFSIKTRLQQDRTKAIASNNIDVAKFAEFKKFDKTSRMYHTRCLMILIEAWACIRQTRGKSGFNQLPGLIQTLNNAESRASVAYAFLVEKNPQNATILRNYASFLADVQNDYDSANKYYALADQIDMEHSDEDLNSMNDSLSRNLDDVIQLDNESSESAPKPPLDALNITETKDLETSLNDERDANHKKASFLFAQSNSLGKMVTSKNGASQGLASMLEGSSTPENNDYMIGLKTRLEKPVERLKTSLKFTTLIIFVVLITKFIVFYEFTDHHKHNALSTYNNTRRGFLIQSLALNSRYMELYKSENNLEKYQLYSERLYDAAERLELLYLTSLAEDDEIPVLSEYHKSPSIETYFQDAPFEDIRTEKLSLFRYVTSSILAAREIANATFSSNVFRSSSFTFVTLNLINDGFDAIYHTIDLFFEDDEVQDVVAAVKSNTLTGIYCGLLALLGFFIILPTIIFMKRERMETISVFQHIPKQTVNSVIADLQTKLENWKSQQGKETVINVEDERKETQSTRTEWKLHMSYWGVLITLIVLYIVFYRNNQSFRTTIEAYGSTMHRLSLRENYIRRMHLLALETIRNDSNIWQTDQILKERINSTLSSLKDHHNAIIGGDEEDLVISITSLPERCQTYYFHATCLLKNLAACESRVLNETIGITKSSVTNGLAPIVEKFYNTAMSFSNLKSPTMNNLIFGYMKDIEENELYYGLSELASIVEEEYIKIFAQFELYSALIYGSELLLLILGYVFVFRKVSAHIEQESKRTGKLISMIPTNEIKNVPELQAFFNLEKKLSQNFMRRKSSVRGSQIIKEAPVIVIGEGPFKTDQ